MIDANLQIEMLNVDDYDAICAVWKACGVKLRLQGRESRQSFARQMESGLQAVLGARIDGQLVGVVLTTHDGRRGWINRLGVLPSFQRRGVARRLIESADKYLHEQGLTIIAVLVEHYNEASRRLFESEGFILEQTYYLTKRDSPDA